MGRWGDWARIAGESVDVLVFMDVDDGAIRVKGGEYVSNCSMNMVDELLYGCSCVNRVTRVEVNSQGYQFFL